jgi:hypothetical protein
MKALLAEAECVSHRRSFRLRCHRGRLDGKAAALNLGKGGIRIACNEPGEPSGGVAGKSLACSTPALWSDLELSDLELLMEHSIG